MTSNPLNDFWNAQTDDWTTAADWTNGVPTSSSVVFIQQGDPQITSAATAASIEVQNGAALSIGAALTLGSAGLTLDAGSTVHFPSIQSTSFAVHLAGAATIDTGPFGSDDDVFNGVISGAGSLSTTGGSNLELDGANTFSGGVTANGIAWVALLGSASGLGSGALTLKSGAHLILGINATVANQIFLDNGAAIAVNASDDTTLSGTIADISGGARAPWLSMALERSPFPAPTPTPAARKSLAARRCRSTDSTNIANGALTLDGGSTLVLDSNSSPSFGDAIALAGAATVNSNNDYNDFGNEKLTGVLSGSGSLIVTGGGEIELGQRRQLLFRRNDRRRQPA